MMMFSWHLVTSDVGLAWLDICMTFSDILSYFLHMVMVPRSRVTEPDIFCLQYALL